MSKRIDVEFVLKWEASAAFMTLLSRDDVKLMLLVNNHMGKWNVLALETRQEVAENILDDHAHKIIGIYDSPVKAITAAEGFARSWSRKAEVDAE